MTDVVRTPEEALDHLRRTDPTHAAQAAQIAARQAEEAETSARRLAAEAQAAAENLRQVEAREAAFQASLEQVKQEFLAEADPLTSRKVPTIPAMQELARSIRAAQNKFFLNVEALGASSGERLQARLFAERTVTQHPTALILHWLRPLIGNG